MRTAFSQFPTVLMVDAETSEPRVAATDVPPPEGPHDEPALIVAMAVRTLAFLYIQTIDLRAIQMYGLREEVRRAIRPVTTRWNLRDADHPAVVAVATEAERDQLRVWDAFVSLRLSPSSAQAERIWSAASELMRRNSRRRAGYEAAEVAVRHYSTLNTLTY